MKFYLNYLCFKIILFKIFELVSNWILELEPGLSTLCTGIYYSKMLGLGGHELKVLNHSFESKTLTVLDMEIMESKLEWF